MQLVLSQVTLSWLENRLKISLRSKRFHYVLEQRKTEEGDFRFWPSEKWNESQKMKEGEWKGKKGNLLSSPPPPRSFTCAIFRAVSLTLVPRSLLLNHTETLVMQANWKYTLCFSNKGPREIWPFCLFINYAYLCTLLREASLCRRKAGEKAIFSGAPVRAEPHTKRGCNGNLSMPVKFGYEAYFSFQLGFKIIEFLYCHHKMKYNCCQVSFYCFSKLICLFGFSLREVSQSNGIHRWLRLW